MPDHDAVGRIDITEDRVPRLSVPVLRETEQREVLARARIALDRSTESATAGPPRVVRRVDDQSRRSDSNR